MKQSQREAYRSHLRDMARAETLEEMMASKMWALSCIDNMRKSVSEKEASDMETTVKVFEYKARKRLVL